MYRAEVLCHSKPSEWDGPELMTALVEYPRIVLAEVVTHRKVYDNFGECDTVTSDRTTTDDMSKNSASSRAIPLWKMIQKVWTDPYVPDRFSAAGKGMQGAGWLVDGSDALARRSWLAASDDAIAHALMMTTTADADDIFNWVPGLHRALYARVRPAEQPSVGVHKQDVNRLLEPWAWVTQVLTADQFGWNNFYGLRCDAAAHPAFQRVARMLYLRHRESSPEPLRYGQWHLPFVDLADRKDFVWLPEVGADLPDPIQFSAARTGWVSYENHDKDGTPDQMRNTFKRFLGGTPKHGSPVEHQATPVDERQPEAVPSLRSNLRGWVQARKLVRDERIDVYAPSADEIASWGLR